MKRPIAICLMLIACTAARDMPPAATAMIAVSSGGMLGQSGTQIFGDDRVVTTSFDFGRATPPTEQSVPGAYVRAAAVIRAEGARTKAQFRPQDRICMDYGTDLVQAVPPITGFDQVATGCPDAAVTALMDHVMAAIAP